MLCGEKRLKIKLHVHSQFNTNKKWSKTFEEKKHICRRLHLSKVSLEKGHDYIKIQTSLHNRQWSLHYCKLFP